MDAATGPPANNPQSQSGLPASPKSNPAREPLSRFLCNVLELHRVFLNHPELRPYFFEGKDINCTALR
jgi:hypothetical protein